MYVFCVPTGAFQCCGFFSRYDLKQLNMDIVDVWITVIGLFLTGCNILAIHRSVVFFMSWLIWASRIPIGHSGCNPI